MRDAVALMTGGLSLIAWLVVALSQNVKTQWTWWICGAVALLVTAFRVWQKEHRLLTDLKTPRLVFVDDIDAGRSGAHYRVKVRNRSLVNITNVNVMWLESRPSLVESLIQLHCSGKTRPESGFVNLQPEGVAWFDVCRVRNDNLEITGANPHQEFKIPKERYRVVLQMKADNMAPQEAVLILDATGDQVIFKLAEPGV